MKPTLLTILAALSWTLSHPLPAIPLFKNSVVSNDLEFIRSDDPSSFKSFKKIGRDRKEMPDRRSDQLIDEQAHIFEILFNDQIKTEIWAHQSFTDQKELEQLITLISQALGKLPKFMRQTLSHVVLHQGDELAFGEEIGRFFVLYSDNIRKRVKTHDLEETVFHEAVHATLEKEHAKNPLWLTAQKKDGEFITEYAARLPLKEDLPESALFAYTILKHPGRLPAETEKAIRQLIPHRLAYFQTLFTPPLNLKKNAR